MWFLLSVDYLVATKSAGLSKALAANLTDERANARMNGHMAGEIVMSIKALAAIVALEHLIAWLVARCVVGCLRLFLLILISGLH